MKVDIIKPLLRWSRCDRVGLHSLPKELDEKVAELHFQVLSTEFFFPVVTWISPGVPSAGSTRHKKSTLRAHQMAHAEISRQCGADPAGGKIHAISL